MTMQSHVLAPAGHNATSIAKPLQLTSAFLLGIAILFGAAFVQSPTVHNAAHDMRHSQGFPCH